jgi:2,3-bisphosphoglycerate-independent phosphoglycerate mutase
MNTDIHKTCLIILDGLGINPREEGNAVRQASTPCLDRLFESCPNATLTTHGKSVGLPEGQMGNSEVGHLNIGAGRVIKQSLVRIADDLNEKYLEMSDPFQRWKTHLAPESTIHLIGLMSDGGVHSHIDHLLKLIHLLGNLNKPIKLHLITDGRDTSPTGGISYLEAVDHITKQFESVSIASICGRYFAMDRDKRWERVEVAYRTIMEGANQLHSSPFEFLSNRYSEEQTDEYIEPASFGDYQGIQTNDAAIFYNFRADRMRQFVRASVDPDFNHFPRSNIFEKARVLTFTEYEKDFPLPCVFPAQTISDHIGAVIADRGLSQLRAAETEKYPHVTYFFNGGIEKQCPQEERILVPSPKDVATYDQKPEMSAYELTDAVLEKLKNEAFSFCVVNYANCDMVGHTGVLAAAIKAVETVDTCLHKLLEFLQANGWCALVIADHGNAEQMIDYTTNEPHTAHTTYPVPIVLAAMPAEHPLANRPKLDPGALCDIAPTLLALMGIPKRESMTGRALIRSTES